jgi:hypothetical protein
VIQLVLPLHECATEPLHSAAEPIAECATGEAAAESTAEPPFFC